MACSCGGLGSNLTPPTPPFFRLTEQVRLKMDLERIMNALRERYRETQEWQRRHKVSGGRGGRRGEERGGMNVGRDGCEGRRGEGWM